MFLRRLALAGALLAGVLTASVTPGAAVAEQRANQVPAASADAGGEGAYPKPSGQTAQLSTPATACRDAIRQAVATQQYTACVEPAAVSAGALRAARDRIWQWPDWCDDHGVANTWFITRTNGCGVFGYEMKVLDSRGRTVGGIKYMSVGYEFSARDSKRWAYQVVHLEVRRWGDGTAGTKVQGKAKCKKKCKIANGSFPSQAMGANKEPYGQFFLDTTINTARRGQQGSGRGIISWKLTNPQWGSTNPVELSTSDVRCDTALPGRTRQVGCINPGYIPEMVYAKSGEFPELAEHIEYAQNVKNLPGKHGTTRYLERLTNTAKRDANRNKACPTSRPRPTGKSCDEYPFASTWQGAATGSGDYSWRMINARQNSKGGTALNNFYTYNRIIEKDRFLVWIKP
ncbi:NucA/NucB deoxyribonuclease domain-containing protein [Streptomyces avermitilis]|uniref:NucA/NucB deoxyribonuclease domain-containing protein n=1 Tax=Streptomyces avermitilis TaxID=33903 RepID=UPI0033A7950B